MLFDPKVPGSRSSVLKDKKCYFWLIIIIKNQQLLYHFQLVSKWNEFGLPRKQKTCYSFIILIGDAPMLLILAIECLWTFCCFVQRAKSDSLLDVDLPKINAKRFSNSESAEL